ncbi:MAG: cadherin repeat domain-containing protein [Cycloclasticus sp.]
MVDAGAAVSAFTPLAPNDPPIFDFNYGPIDIKENTLTANAGAVVIDVNASDPEGDVITYSIDSGNTSGDFNIDPSTGVIAIAHSLDYERTSTYTLAIEISDDLNTVQQNIDIYIEDDLADNNDPTETDNDGDGYFTPEDCDDDDSQTYPGHQDSRGKWGKNGVDNDCNGIIGG